MSRPHLRVFNISKWAILSLAMALLMPLAAQAQNLGKVGIVKATGSVTAVSIKTGERKPVKDGNVLLQGTRLETGKDSSAILLFSNGSTITVGPQSNFSVDSFLQDPFDEKAVDYRNIKEEPSKSTVKTTFTKGEILGDMAKLKPGSSFQFATQLGVAGIRGTKFKMTMSTGPNGKPVWNIVCTEGAVSVQPTKNGQPFGAPIVVTPTADGSQGTQITLTLDENGDLVPVGDPTPISAEETAAINSEIATSDNAINNLPEGYVPGEGETLFNDNPDGTNNFGGDQGPLNLGTFGAGSGGGQTNGDIQPSS